MCLWERRDWGGFFFFLQCFSNEFIHLFLQNYQIRETGLCGLVLVLFVLLFCLSGSKLQTVSNCGQEEVHATILCGNEPHPTEPATWHRGGFRSHAS